MADLEALAKKISTKSPAVRAFALEAARRITALEDDAATPAPVPVATPTPTPVPTPTPTPTPTPGPVTVDPPVGPFTIIDRNFQAAYGIEFRGRGGAIFKHTHVKRASGWGFADMMWHPPAGPSLATTVCEDCIADDIQGSPPKIMDGKGEAGFWFENTTKATRLLARRCAWSGMETTNSCIGSDISHFTLLQGLGSGLYVERITADTVFHHFEIEGAESSITVEWWYDGYGSYRNKFLTGRVYCPPQITDNSPSAGTRAGIFLDAGNWGFEIAGVTFWGPGDAVGLPNNLAGPDPNTVDLASCTFLNAGRQVYRHDRQIG